MISKMNNEDRSTSASSDKLKLLLIEDTPAIRSQLIEILASPQIEVVIAADGAEAFTLFCHGDFDVVVTDIRMPILNGRLATQFMRTFEESHPELDPTPIIAISSDATDADREKCFAAGVDAFVSKPLDRLKLLKTIEHFTNANVDYAISNRPEGGRKLTLRQSSPLPSHETAFDREAALARMGGDESLLIHMIYIYQSDHHDLINNIKTAVDRADLQMAARHAHSLKGLAATIGGAEVVQATEEFGMAVQNKSLAMLETAFEQLMIANSELLEQLRDFAE